ncbi:MAG: hypothetical protein JSW65_04585 [Candidatus Bipolaricaulota bacterium]|nr:MAG: hypothetical protein JSW65_04585 [Candidatus Bipolaricaulota bacterium]
MDERLRQAWVSVQKAETKLVLTGVKLHPQEPIPPEARLDIDPSVRQVFARAASCFDPKEIRARDYLVRFPFSTVRAVERQLDALVTAGALTGLRKGKYALTAQGERTMRALTERVGASIDRLDLGVITEDQVGRLLAYDRRILEALTESVQGSPSPIFEHRLRGLQPDYDPPKRWHHWQLAWTMIAAHEDAEQQVREDRGIGPLAWFARHELWFTARRPHRGRMQSCADLAKVAERYAPLANPEEDCRAALEELRKRGWIDGVGADCDLTDQGIEAADRDEDEVEERFLARWPCLPGGEVEELKGIADAINERCEELEQRFEATSRRR